MGCGASTSDAKRLQAQEDSLQGGLQEQYNLGDKLGDDGFWQLMKATRRTDSQAVIVKKARREGQAQASRLALQSDGAVDSEATKPFKQMALMEMDLLKRLSTNIPHDRIARMLDAFKDDENYYIVMELKVSRDLKDMVVNGQPEGHLAEDAGLNYARQLFSAVTHLHSNSICHRDLKLENAFLGTSATGSEVPDLKVGGFTCGTIFKPGKYMTTRTGSPLYVDPHVIVGKYSQLCDVWSLGVCCYAMFYGFSPFQADNEVEILQKVCKGSYGFPNNAQYKVSEHAKNLIRNCLKMKPEERFSAADNMKYLTSSPFVAA